MTILRQNLFRARQLTSWRFRLSDKTVRKFAQLSIHYQRQKYSPWIRVCRKLRFMRTFSGVRWRGGVKWEWGRRKWRLFFFARYILRTFTSKPQLLCSPLVAPQWHRNRWPWMTLNGDFALKSVSDLAWIGVLPFKQNCSEMCRPFFHILSPTVSGSNVAQGL